MSKKERVIRVLYSYILPGLLIYGMETSTLTKKSHDTEGDWRKNAGKEQSSMS